MSEDPNRKRQQDLKANIRETLDLIKQYEDKFRLADDPKEKRRCEQHITELRQLLTRHEADLEDLESAIDKASSDVLTRPKAPLREQAPFSPESCTSSENLMERSVFVPIFQQLEALADFYAGCDPLRLDPQSLEDHQRRLSKAKSTLLQIRKQRTDVARMIAAYPFSPRDIANKIKTAEKYLGLVRQYVEEEKKPGKYFDAVHRLSDVLEDLVIKFRRRKR